MKLVSVNSSNLGPNVLLSTLFSKLLRFLYTVNARLVGHVTSSVTYMSAWTVENM
jgi:hypothetical protein